MLSPLVVDAIIVTDVIVKITFVHDLNRNVVLDRWTSPVNISVEEFWGQDWFRRRFSFS